MCGAVYLNSDYNEACSLVQERVLIQVCTPFCQEGLAFFCHTCSFILYKKVQMMLSYMLWVIQSSVQVQCCSCILSLVTAQAPYLVFGG